MLNVNNEILNGLDQHKPRIHVELSIANLPELNLPATSAHKLEPAARLPTLQQIELICLGVVLPLE